MIKQQEPLIYKVCYIFAHRNPDGMRDLYQDIVCALWQSRRQFRGDSNIKTWVYHVALNTATNHRRRKLKEDIICPLPNNIVEMPYIGSDELVDRLYCLISHLPAKEQKIVYLYIDGFSIEAIAEILGTSYNATGIRLHRIKKSLIQLNKQME